MLVDVVHFVKPHGRQVPGQFEISDRVKDEYEELTRAGLRITAEIFLPGQVSLCVEDYDRGDFLTEFGPNGPGLLEAVEKLIGRFDIDAYHDWVAQYEAGEPDWDEETEEGDQEEAGSGQSS